MVRGYWCCARGPESGNQQLNVVVFGPDLESRRLPDWPLKPIPNGSLTALEVLVRRVGQEVYGASPVAIVGAPWVNPRGRSRATASIGDYLCDPVHLYRALTVAFSGVHRRAQSALVAADAPLHSELTSAMAWVAPRLALGLPRDRVVWVALDPELGELFRADAAVTIGVDRDLARERMQTLSLSTTEGALGSLCAALRPLFA